MGIMIIIIFHIIIHPCIPEMTVTDGRQETILSFGVILLLFFLQYIVNDLVM